MRVLLAGLLGGIAMYVWSTVAHVATPLGTTGISKMHSEQTVLGALSEGNGSERGLYLVPAGGPTAGPLPAEGPLAFVVYRPHVRYALNPSNLIVEFLTELVDSIIAAYLLSLTFLAGFAARTGFVTLVGIAASIATNIPYWNWYGFPTDYTVGYSVIQIIGYLAAGLAISAVLRPQPRAA
ncbi:MAG: hypothetical protein JOZ55_01975 [Alphaproteobacteria bacterium]|nr:hypothetical protein [Alphaproteobacteria bacterium]